MQNIIPALLTLHIFGVVLWMGGTIVQYLFLSDHLTDQNKNHVRLTLFLTHRIYQFMIWYGVAMIALSGITIIFMFGIEWLRPRVFIHIKITFAIVFIVLTYLSWKKFTAIKIISEQELSDPNDEQRLHTAIQGWRKIIIINLIGMGCIVLLGIYKFGFF
jgi:uncharacterized membrane protein